MNKVIKLLIGVVLIILFTTIDIDLPGGIPITGQSFIVLVVAFVLGRPLGWMAVGIYLVLGLVGLPVFADGASGIAILKGGSGGYLIGFLAAAYFVARRSDDRSIRNISVCMILGTVIILIFGVGKLVLDYGFVKGLEYGLYPFYKGAIVKIVLSVLVLLGWNRFVEVEEVKNR